VKKVGGRRSHAFPPHYTTGLDNAERQNLRSFCGTGGFMERGHETSKQNFGAYGLVSKEFLVIATELLIA